MATYADDVRLDAWSVDKFGGRYVHDSEMLRVFRQGHRLYVDGWTLGRRQIHADNVESWTWADGCGVEYRFVLPPDGLGAWLTVVVPRGAMTEWHRSAS